MKPSLFATAMVLMVAPAANAGETYSYACEVKEDVDGRVVKGENYHRKFLYLLQIKDHRLIWRGKNYHIVNQPACAKSGWHATGHGISFDFCTATQGVAGIDNSTDDLIGGENCDILLKD